MKSPGSAMLIHAVMAAALEEFTAKGYADARLDTIASSSGVSKRMLHYHCGDKIWPLPRHLGARPGKGSPPR